MHFREDKIKSILFASKRKIKKVPKQEIIYSNIRKILDSHFPGLNTLGNDVRGINGSQSLYQSQCKSFFIEKINIYPHICIAYFATPEYRVNDHTCFVRYPNLYKYLRNKIQTSQNKCICSVHSPIKFQIYQI